MPIYPPPPPTFALAKRLLPFLFLLLGVIAIGVLAFLLLAPSDTALANPPSQSGETSGYDGPAPTPVPEHRVPVDWPLIPSGLGPGDSFRLLFLTSNKGDATSGNINTYISRVQNRADAGHTAIKPYANDFRPVISTAAPSYIGAQEVLSFSSYNTWIPQAAGNVPVYWLNGAKVADASWDFFDDSWDSHDARNEWGASMAHISLSEKRAWTGSSHDGWGWYPAGEDWVRTGVLRTYDEIEDDARPKGEHHRLYAMSPVFTVDRTRARATFGVIEERHDTGCNDQYFYNPRYLSGPSVVYRGNTYTYEFRHNAVKRADVGNPCRTAGTSIRSVVGLVSGTGTVSGNSGRDSTDAAWLDTDTESTVATADDSTLVGKNSACYRTGNRHRTQWDEMSVYVPDNAPRGSTFHIAFFGWQGSWCDPTRVNTRSGVDDWNWGGLTGTEQVELGTVGTVTVAPVPDAPGKPWVAWGPTRNSARIEFPANTHQGSEYIYSYGVEVRRYFSDTDTFTDWTWKANVDECSSGTCSALVTGLAGTSHYQVRVFARARMWSGGQTYYGPVSDERGFDTRSTADPDPPTGFGADEVFYNRVKVSWSAPGYTGWYSDPVHEYTIHARRWAGSFWTPWEWAAAVGGSARSETVTGYFEYGTWKPFEPGNIYQLRVAAKIRRQGDASAVHWSAWSETTQINTISPVPVAPQRPWKTELTHDSVRVSWHPLTNDGAGRIYSWGVQTRLWIPLPVGTWTPWVTVANPGGDTRSVVLSGLAPDTDYQVRVFARARTSPQSETFWSPTSPVEGIKTRTLRASAPEAPVLSNPQTLPQRIDVSWSAPEWGGATPIHDYDLEVYVGNAWRGSVPNAGGTGTSLTLTGYRQGNTDMALEPGEQYRVRVRANNRDGGGNVRNGDWSDPSSFVETLPGAPNAPAAATISQVGSVSVGVSWNAPDPYTGASPIHDYDLEVRQRQDDGTWGAWAASHPAHHDATRSRTLFGLNHYGGGDPIDFSPSTDYQVRVRANNQERDADGNVTGTRRGAWSDATAFRTAPGVPAGFIAIAQDGSVRLLWTAPSTDPAEVSRYTVEHADNAQFTGAQTVETAASDPDADTQAPTELTVTGLANGTETHFRVRAVRTADGADTPGDWSAAASATPTGAVDYDADNDGLIEIKSLAQLNAVRWDLDGDGTAAAGHDIDYLGAFPVPMAGMGCPAVVGESGGCQGYELAADLDFTGSEWAGGDGWLPIGHTGNNEDPAGYGGVFDGNGRAISNLHVDRDGLTRVGLFAAVVSGGVVRDLGLSDADVTGNDGVGALAGVNNGTVRRAWSTGEVDGRATAIGGLVGWNGSGDLIAESWSSASVSSSLGSVGGLVGRNRGAVTGSYATGQASSTSGNNIGGLAGWNDSTGAITASYASGRVSSTSGSNLGGLAGRNGGSVGDSYAVGWVDARSGAGGGLVGLNDGGSVANSYALGLVTAPANADGVGGLVGADSNGTATGSQWNRETAQRVFGLGADDTDNDNTLDSGETNTLSGSTAAELKAPTDSTGIYTGWSADSWDFGANYNYPALKADHDGDGTATWQEFGKQRGPGPVTGLRAALEDRSGVLTLAVTWSPPTDRGGSDAAGLTYRLRQSIDGGQTWGTYIDCADTDVSCGAQGGSWQTDASAGVNAVEVQSLGNAVHGFGATASIGPPGAPRNLTVLGYDTALGLTWAAPADDGGAAVDSYRVQYRAGTSGDWTAWELVEEDTQVQRTATPGAADSNAVTTTVTTEENGVTTTVITTTSTKNGVTHVTITTRTSTAVITGTEALIEELTTGTAYQVRVAAVSVLGRGPTPRIRPPPTRRRGRPACPATCRSLRGTGS